METMLFLSLMLLTRIDISITLLSIETQILTAPPDCSESTLKGINIIDIIHKKYNKNSKYKYSLLVKQVLFDVIFL